MARSTAAKPRLVLGQREQRQAFSEGNGDLCPPRDVTLGNGAQQGWCPWRSPFLSRALRLLIWKMRLLDCPPPVPSGLEPWALLVLCSAPTRLSWSLCSMGTGASPLDSPRCCGSSGENLPSSCSDTKHATWFSPDTEEDSH